jgi:cysteine synthase A
VTVFSDSNKKYLSTDLMRTEAVKEGYYTPDIELIDFSVFKRVCMTCCDRESCIASPEKSCHAFCN